MSKIYKLSSSFLYYFDKKIQWYLWSQVPLNHLIQHQCFCLLKTKRTVNVFLSKVPHFYTGVTHPWLFNKSKFKLKSNRVNLVASASPIECPMSGRYSTNWDQKGWPCSENQMYYTAARPWCVWFTAWDPAGGIFLSGKVFNSDNFLLLSCCISTAF